MQIVPNEQIRRLMWLCTTTNQVDKIINENYHFKTVQEKIAFLKGMFNITLGHEFDEPNEVMYQTMLVNFLNTRWNY